MDKLFITILNNALVANWIILAVIICRQLFRKAPKWINFILWGLVAVRLAIPFSIESIFSLVPSARPVPADIEYAKVPQINSGIATINTLVNPVLENNFVADEIASANPMQIVIFILSHVWIIGVAGLFIYAVVSSFMIKRRVRTAQLIEKGIYECDNIESPFILGIVRPRVYVPVCMDKESYECVLEHEKAHIRRLDHIWKPLGFLILAVYWFNPLCWIAYIMLCKDIEYACDERVTRDKDKDWKAKYCQVLLDCSSQRRLVSACPVAFGEVSVKDRIKSVINYKKPAFWIIVAAVVISVIVAVCFMTNPRKEESAEKESLIEIADVDENDSDIVEYNIDKNQLFVKFWATAFCKKDSEVLYKYSSDDVRTALALEKVNDEYVLGESSPWPRDGWYSIEELHDNSAMIDYYAVTPDSHVTVWRQYITFSIDETDKENDFVKAVNTKKYENIVLGSDFDLAYSNGLLWMDYNKNGFGEKLNSKALLSSGLTYKDLFEPDTAARYFLNLLKNDKKVPIEVIDGANENEKILNITFMEDNQVRTVKMIRPWGNTGIWIPSDMENEDILKTEVIKPRLVPELPEPKELEVWENKVGTKVRIVCHNEFAESMPAQGSIVKIDELIERVHPFTGEVRLEKIAPNDSYSVTGADKLNENMNVDYVEDNGQYIVEGDMVFMYKKVLVGKQPSAACSMQYIVLTNDENITWEEVDRSLYSSDSKDWLYGTIIIGINPIE